MLKPFPSKSAAGRQRDKVVFLHCLKTGGTTFSRVLQRLYGDSYTFFDDEAVDAFARTLAAYDCMEVHTKLRGDQLVWGTKNIMKESNWGLLSGAKVFVMFRDPVECYISNFYQTQKTAKTLKGRAAQTWSSPDTLDGCLEDPNYSNLQLKFLLGVKPGDDRVLTDEDLRSAKRLISTLGINVGILERYDESLHLFEHVTGSRIPLGIVVIRNKNRVPRAQRGVDDAKRQRIRNMNALDQGLYDFAKTLFGEQIAGCGPCPRYRYLSENSIFVRCRDLVTTVRARGALRR
ncbi:MAG: hypothetical protein CMJ23_10790 [Phycisphaerae bacterium]|nr:hypothetical protein [Phycisphaerae bacterium]